MQLSRFTTDDFCAALISAVVVEGKQRVPIDHPEVDLALREIVSLLQAEAEATLRSGDETTAFHILKVLRDLRPNPNTGAFDSFWFFLRRQQPGRLGVPNPHYEHVQIRLSSAQAEHEMSELSEPWHHLVAQSAQRLAERI